jgi:hypothetical protein
MSDDAVFKPGEIRNIRVLVEWADTDDKWQGAVEGAIKSIDVDGRNLRGWKPTQPTDARSLDAAGQVEWQATKDPAHRSISSVVVPFRQIAQ